MGLNGNRRKNFILNMNLILRYLPLIIVLIGFNCYGQMYQRKKIPLVALDGSYKMQHFYLSPGLTFMLPNFQNNENDTINAFGRVALNLEAGIYKIFKSGGNIFNYMDYGLAYKKLSGTEKNPKKNVFKHHYLSFNYNLNNIYQLTNTKFIESTIGANFDWKFTEKQKENIKPNNTKSFLFSFHLKFGYGMKFQNRLFIIPSIETPILNLLEWENGKSNYSIFNSRYRPFIMRVKILWLKRPSKRDCPPVKLNSEDKARYQNNYMQ